MSTKELVAEEVKRLPDIQTEAVLRFIRELSDSPALSAAELMHLAPADRRRILADQARLAEVLYRQDPEVIVEDAEAPLNYG
jgi:hypothetical protein